MSYKAAGDKKEASVEGARLLVIDARFHEAIADELVAGAQARIEAANARMDRISVPGALEIPIAASIAMGSGRYDGVVALGCIIRGETEHFGIVAYESAHALMRLGTRKRVPVGNGILTVENEAQAWTRARRTEGDKGGEAASAALALVRIARAQGR
ncbi:MAG: 6,7-dimethyl-8-ribityllumazine synthase [Xanthobacteraceae bacterium]|nr:6,7-dimethyl-8-ribityllumazine synthase [Xanthobacteraceae bacterium]QYK43697.1 MAG: 6,7-dimethyl-8-ribityllumazine synthase [Xanthobacteraceae bacterium]